MIAEALNAVRLRVDWRPFAGLTSADEGTIEERVIARVVLRAAVDAHNDDVKRAQKG